MTKIALFFAAIAALSACVQQPKLTIEQLDSRLAENQVAAKRFYPGKSVAQTKKASQQVLMLLDPDDMTFDVREDQLLATRFSTYYAVFAVGFGRDWYAVSMKELPGGTEASFRVSGVMNSGLIVTPPAQGFRSDIDVGAHDNPADYKLFHDRVEYILGIRQDWTTCESAKALAKNKDQQMMLCDLIGLENIDPRQKNSKPAE